MWCNDWVLLQNFVWNKNIFSLWVEPSLNVSKLSKDKWINVINDFFSLKSSEDIKKTYWNFDVITGSNMFAHIDNIIDVIRWVKNLLNKNWVFIFEVHYLLDFIK
jgi:2-polyprenyl-3-methyl-5-hydroxy-6-metoxy-1,4-benzoquinol methylase